MSYHPQHQHQQQHQQPPPPSPYAGMSPYNAAPAQPPTGYPPGTPMSATPPQINPYSPGPYAAQPPVAAIPQQPQPQQPYSVNPSPYSQNLLTPTAPVMHQPIASLPHHHHHHHPQQQQTYPPTPPPPPLPQQQQQAPYYGSAPVSTPMTYNTPPLSHAYNPNPPLHQHHHHHHHPSSLPPNMSMHTPQPHLQQPYSFPNAPGATSSPYPPVNTTVLGIQVDGYGLPVVPGDIPVQYATKYRVEEKIVSATRDSFSVFDQSGTIRYKVDGLLSFTERKLMKDIHGTTLLKLREARLKLRDKITIFNAQNIAMLTLQKASAIQIGSKRVHGYLGTKTTGLPQLTITGNSNNTRFHIFSSRNQPIADIHRRKFSLKNVLTDQDTYDVTVNCSSPALICFITVAIDEIYED